MSQVLREYLSDTVCTGYSILIARKLFPTADVTAVRVPSVPYGVVVSRSCPLTVAICEGCGFKMTCREQFYSTQRTRFDLRKLFPTSQVRTGGLRRKRGKVLPQKSAVSVEASSMRACNTD